MKVIYLNEENVAYYKEQSRENVLALGFFDGVHLGHRQVIHKAKHIAKEKNIPLTVMTFFPHPKTIFSKKNRSFHYLIPLSKKINLLQLLGVDTLYIVTFNRSFSSLTPEMFVSKYIVDFRVVHAVAGYDFSYGHMGTGRIDRLQGDANDMIDVTKVDKVDYQGRKISSTWIRELISKGNVQKVAHILGSHYETDLMWDGRCLQIRPRYMLPAPGKYNVHFHLGERIINCEARIYPNQKNIHLQDSFVKQLRPNHTYQITWIEQISTYHHASEEQKIYV